MPLHWSRREGDLQAQHPGPPDKNPNSWPGRRWDSSFAGFQRVFEVAGMDGLFSSTGFSNFNVVSMTANLSLIAMTCDRSCSALAKWLSISFISLVIVALLMLRV